MKCPKCGLENRPDARFCKQCGQLLQAQTTPSPGNACPACGATTKPGARFCPRCGKPIPAAPTQPPPSMADTIPAIPSHPQPHAPPPPSYAQPPVQPPPLATPSVPERQRRFPRWAGWTAAIAASLCVVALVVTAKVFGPKLLGGEEEPTATAMPAASPTVEAPLTQAPTAEPTATSTLEAPLAPAFDAQVVIVASAAELQVGDILTITVTITNTGQVTFGNLRYQLLGEWEPFLGAPTGAVLGHEVDVPPGGSNTATFILEATQIGTAQLYADVTVDTREDTPSTKPISPEYIVEVSIIQ